MSKEKEKKRASSDVVDEIKEPHYEAPHVHDFDGASYNIDDVDVGTMEDVEAVMTDLVYSIRSMLVALPGRLAVDVSSAATAAEASDIIRAEVYKILEELAAYKYDPEEYARRVRDREGWSELADDADD